MKRRRSALALPWLIACLHGASWADPMKPLIPPPAASGAAAATAAPDRAARPRDPEGPRDPERLVAIRQDSASRWQALFGERWVGVGDKLERYTVVAVDANAVQLAEGRQRKTVHLLPPLWRPAPAAAASAAGPLASRSPDVVQAQAPASPVRAVPGVLSP